jgi:hypothetical protein
MLKLAGNKNLIVENRESVKNFAEIKDRNSVLKKSASTSIVERIRQNKEVIEYEKKVK